MDLLSAGVVFFDPSQPTEADRRNLSDLIGRQNAEEMLGHFASVVTGEERETFVGYGFEIVGIPSWFPLSTHLTVCHCNWR